MKETKRVWKHFSYRECDAFAAYLEEMALKGWHLKEIGLGMKFQKGEPMKVRYEIEVFTKATKFDMIPAPATEEFAEYCKEAGWEFVCAFQQFCVFRTKDPEVVPIQTDPKQRFEQIYKTEKNGKLVTFVVWSVVFCFGLLSISNNPDKLLENLTLTLILVAASAFLTSLVAFLETLYWGFKNQRKIDLGESATYKPKSIFLKAGLIIVLFMIALGITSVSIYEQDYELLFYLCGLSITILCIQIASIKLKLNREHTYLLGAVIYIAACSTLSFGGEFRFESTNKLTEVNQVDIPLTLSDLTDGKNKTDSEYSVEALTEESMLAVKTYYWFINEKNRGTEPLYYEIIESKSDWVLNCYWKKYTKYQYEKVSDKEAKQWGAQKVAKNYSITPGYIIWYPDRMIFLHYEDKITPHAIEAVKKIGKIQRNL